MANWQMTPSANFDAEQAERVAVFDKIAPRDNWKAPIDAWIAESDFRECSEAAVWFTGAKIEIVERDGGDRVRVVGPGYYATIGA
jgi:hypothetical protein